MSRNIAFIGGDSQVGTTMVAQSTAELLAQRQQKVLFVPASGKPGDDYYQNRERRSIDDIRANLVNGYLDPEELNMNLICEKGVWILPGVRDHFVGKYYTDNSMEALFQAASGYDYIIADCGDDCRMGIALSAMVNCPERFFVITQQSKCTRRMMLMEKGIFRPLELKGELIINKYVGSVSLPGETELSGLFERGSAGSVPYVEYGWQCEIRQETLNGAGRYRRGVSAIADKILDVKEEKSWKNSLIWKRT